MLPLGRAGVRLHGIAARPRLRAGAGGGATAAAAVLGPAARPVRAILFDKTAAANWALPWHQDRTIAVQARIDTPGFGPWTRKGGLLHVEPPAALQAGMATLRLRLDPVPPGNAPCWPRQDRTAWAASRRPKSPQSCAAAVSQPAWPGPATSGCIQHQLCTPPPRPLRRDVAAFCRWTMPRRTYRAGCAGWASSAPPARPAPAGAGDRSSPPQQRPSTPGQPSSAHSAPQTRRPTPGTAG